MNTTARSNLASSIGFSLAAFTAVSAFAFGAAATATLIGFSALVMYGLIGITLLAYAPAPYAKRTHVSPAPVRVQRRVVAAIVEYPRAACCRTAA